MNSDMETMHPEKIILCDFDGTITVQDVTDEILNQFADHHWREIGKEYSNGIITHAKMNKKFANLLQVSPAKLKAFLKESIELREGFYSFISLSKETNVPFVIISSGWDFYIKHILRIKGLHFINRIDEIFTFKKNYIPVVSNRLTFNSIKFKWTLKLQWNSKNCKISSPCKGSIARLLKKKGIKDIVVIGNSKTDICMAQEASFVFAAEGLADVCTREIITFKRFHSFKEIGQVLFPPSQKNAFL